MATLSLSSALIEQNGAIRSHSENGSDHDTVLPNLMQKLKMTTKQIKAWSQTSHKLRLAMSKYTEPDPVDPNRLQKCLDKLKMAIKVSSVPAMNERLDAIARQVGLKANWSIDNVYLSSDCFYVEVLLAPNGGVKDVILVHGMNGNLQSCVEMCEVLKKNDFKEFTEHLKGLCQMYQLGGDSKMKTTAFNCLQALEIDLKTLFHISGIKFGASQPQGGSPLLHITKGFVGYLTPRVGGHLMRLTYFVSPYDLLDVEKKQTKELSLKEPLPKDMGLSVTVGIESATQRKIQTAPTIMVTDNKITNVMPLGNQNSIAILATFVLKLSEPMPMSLILLKQLQNIPGVFTQYADPTAATPLNTLICKFTLDPVTFLQNQTKEGRHIKTKNFIVELPDQHHSYIINDGTNPSDLRDMQGALLSKITFTSPNTVVKIISLLRQQAVYNTLIASCVRNKDAEEPPGAVLFEVTPYTNQKLTVTFEHPAREGVACVELDLTDHAAVKARLHGCPSEESFCSDDYATKVLQKCLSIPITMRAIMKKAEQWLETHESQKSVSLPPAPSSGPSGGSVFDPMSGIHRPSGLGGGGGGHGGSFFPSHRPHQSSYSHQLQSHSILSDLTTTMSAILPHGEGFDMHGDKPTKVAQNPMLASLLQHAALAASASSLSIPPPSPSPMSSPPLASGPKPHKNPMLMNLLQEQNTLTPVAAIAQPVGSMGRMIRRGKRVRSVSVDKSPKRQQSEEEHDFDDLHCHRPGLHHRLSDTYKMSSHAMDPPKAMHTGELSALLSEIEAPIIPVMKPKRGRPPRLDSTSSQSSISARQSPKTPSTPTVPTTPTFAPPKTMSHSTLSTPEHPSLDDLPVGIKADHFHSRTSMDSDIFLHNSKNMYEDLLPDPPRSNISPEMNRQSSFRSQYSSLDINDDAAGFDNDDDFGGLPSVSSAIARMGIPTGSEFDDQHRTATDLPHPVSLSTLTSGPLSTAIQAGLETRTDMKMGALDLTVANLAKSMSIPVIPTAQRGRPGPNMQGVTNLSHSMPTTRPRIPVSKGKPKNFIESSLAFQTEKPKPSKKRGRKVVKDTGGLSDSDAPKTKKLRRPGRLRKERRLPEYSSESSPEPCQDVAQYSSITMAVNEEEPLKMTFKTIRHKPDKEQKLKPKDPGPAPKLKIRAMTSGDSATPSPNPIMRDIKEEKPHVKPEHRLEMPEKIEAVVKSIKTEPPVMKSDNPKETKVVKDESLPKPHREVSTGHRSEEQANKGTSQELSKGSHDISMVKLEHSAIKSTPITKVTAMTHMSKIKSEQMKKSRLVEGGQRPSPSVSKSPLAGFFPKKSLANLPRIPKISKQTSESRQSPNPKMPTTPKPAGSPLPSNKTLLGSSPKKSSWGKGDPSKLGTTKKLVTAQRFSSVSPTGRKPDGMKLGKSFSSGNKSPLTVGQGIRKTGPNILSKSMSTPTYSPNSSKASAGPVQTPSRNVSSPTTGMSKMMSSQVKPSGTVSPVPKTSAGSTSKPQITPTSLAVPSKLPSSQGISVTPILKTSSVVPCASATTSSSVTGSSSSTKAISSSSSVTTVPFSSPVTVRPVSVANTSSTSSLSSTTTAVTVNSTTASITMTTPITPSATTSALPVSKSVTPSPVNLVSSSKAPPAIGTKTTPSNRPPPLVIPTNIKVPTPSVTSPSTPSSVGTPTSAGPNSSKQTTPKSGMRGNRKNSLMGIIDKIKEKNEKVEKTDKVEQVEKSEKVERRGLFSALGSGTSGTGDSGNGDEKETDSSEKDTKETDPTEENVAEKSQLPRDKTVVCSKADDTPSKESKAMTFPLTKPDGSKTAVPKVTSATSQLPARQPSPSLSLKPSGLNPSPSSQGSSSVKGKSSPKHPSQSRPPKVGTPPLTGSQKRASSPTGKSISIKQSKPSPLSTSSSSTPTSMNSPVKSRPGTSPVPRTRPIILSHSLSTYQSPEKGQQKVTKVQLAMQPELMSHSIVHGQGTSASNVTKGQTNSSHVRVPSPSIKSQPVSTNKPTQDSTKKPTTVMTKPTDTAKSEIKLVTTPKQLKVDQSASMKSKPNTGKEPSSHSQQNNQRSDAKGSLDSGSSKLHSTVSKKADSKPTDPRARKDSQGPSKDKDSETSKSPKPGVMRTVSKEAKSSFSSGSQDGKTSMKTEQKPTTEAVQKPKVTPPLLKSVSKGDKEKLKSEEIRKSESKNIVPEIKGTDKQEVSEEVNKISASSTKPQGIDFKVPSPAMVPSPKNPAMSPRPVIKPVSSPKPVIAYSPKAPSPHSSTSGVPSPGSAVSPKVPIKRSATPVGNQPPPPKKACAISTPYSPVESDDDFGMIIDMPQSPRSSSQQKPQRSPRPDSRNSNTQTEAGSTSPRSAVAHSPLGQVALSPLGIGKSPASVKSIGSDSISRSPCRIDDDLMDEALTGYVQTEDV